MSVLEVNHVKKIYTTRLGGNKVEALHDISFSVENGEYIAIMGESGSGKTTLLNILAALDKPTAGEVILKGIKLSEVKESQIAQFRRDNLGFVFQDFNLFPQYNVIDNVMLAPRLLAKERPDFKAKRREIYGEIEQTAKELLERVGLSEKLDSYPCELSGGQKQRVSIARALALKPRILFFDEPTSALDPELTGEILKVIRKLAAEHITMVIVTHEIDFASNVSDKVIFMADGVVVEEGAPADVIDNPKNERTRSFLQKLNDK